MTDCIFLNWNYFTVNARASVVRIYFLLSEHNFFFEIDKRLHRKQRCYMPFPLGWEAGEYGGTLPPTSPINLTPGSRPSFPVSHCCASLCCRILHNNEYMYILYFPRPPSRLREWDRKRFLWISQLQPVKCHTHISSSLVKFHYFVLPYPFSKNVGCHVRGLRPRFNERHFLIKLKHILSWWMLPSS